MRTIAIIGGGLAGSLVAVHLLRRGRPGTRIVLIERKPPPGRGVAYGSPFTGHLLNVPVERMGAFPDAPGHFLEWVRAKAGEPGVPAPVAAGDFLPRHLYGRYITEVLSEARRCSASGVEFDVIEGEAMDLEEASPARITLADGRVIEAHRVVLALGNLPGEYPIKRPLPFYRSSRYVHIPWVPDALAGIAPQDDVLIVGAGLTAVDAIVDLALHHHKGTIHALSRRGLRPLAHQTGLPPYPPFLSAAELPTTVSAMTRKLRAEIRSAAARGIDWRAVIDSIRPHLQAIWLSWSWEERSRFLRHVRPHWEVHRHRVAPEIAAQIAQLEREGRVKFYAGRLQSLGEVEGAAAAIFRRRGSDELVALRVAKVINCTGPRHEYSKYQHPLLINLLARGLIDHDPLALGLFAQPTGEVSRYRSGPSDWLFTLGAPLKGILWETTAAAEIRAQAATLAERLLAP